MSDVIRLGFIGAGKNTRRKHFPGFQQIAGVELTGVCNSQESSTSRTAREYQIPQTYSAWQELISDDRIDAVVIGTWPHLHCEITCAALSAGKHVLTEARMASNLSEARQMLAASEAHPELAAMIVPSPFGLAYGEAIKTLIEHGFLGDLREVVVLGANDQFWDPSLFLHPRQTQELSGYNTLSLGILHETVSRWIPQTEQVYAQSKIFEQFRPIENQPNVSAAVTVPDSLQVLTQISGGARGIYHLSGVALFGPGLQIHLYGSEGTIKLQMDSQRDVHDQIFVGRHGENSLTPYVPSRDNSPGWRVEADFISAIRGEKPVTLNSFEIGLQYMEFTEAVHLSAQGNKAVSLPLQ